jgi:glucokinase
MPSSSWPALVADIGGTNARFAMVDGPGAAARDVEVLSTGDHPTLEDAIEAYLKEKGAQRPRAACLAVAGPVTGDLIKFTNHPWEFSINETRDALGLARLAVINDFEALALALPRLAADELLAIGGGAAVDGWPKAVLGPGTGLGVAAAVPTSAGWEALAGDGGHAELAVPDSRLTAAIAILRREHDRLSAEQVLSGRGFEALHRALAEFDGVPCAVDAAAEITEAALDGEARALGTARAFLDTLASFAGDVALMFGARGGVYLGGGIVPRLLPLLDQKRFRAGFAHKGRLRSYLDAVPVHVIRAEMPTFKGCAARLERLAAAG